MLALVLEGTRMLSLNMHMNSTLVLLYKRTMRALKVTGLGANIFKRHGDMLLKAGENSIFSQREYLDVQQYENVSRLHTRPTE